MLVEGEEEIGSANLIGFFNEYKKRIQSDVIVVCDTGNLETGLPSITYSLRGIVAAAVEVQSARTPVHSGVAGGVLADAALALDVILSRLYWKNGRVPIPHFYDKVRPLTDAGAEGDPGAARRRGDVAVGLRRAARRAAGVAGGRRSQRADVAAAGRDDHRPGGQLHQERLESGACPGRRPSLAAGSCRTRTRRRCSPSSRRC